MRTLVIGDIHGGLKAVHQIFERAKITTEDNLIFLGDFVDGWSQSPEVLDFLINLKQTHNCVFVKGNHDQLLHDWLTENYQHFDEKLWLTHGGGSTKTAYEKIDIETKNKHIAFLKSLENYHIDAQKRLFIHAGFTNLKGVEYEYFTESFYWDRTLWEMALSLDNRIEKSSLFYPNRLKIYKEIYLGHTPTTKVNNLFPTKKATVWNVDTGAGFRGKLSALDINSKQFWQSDSLPDLYPKEEGRS